MCCCIATKSLKGGAVVDVWVQSVSKHRFRLTIKVIFSSTRAGNSYFVLLRISEAAAMISKAWSGGGTTKSLS